MPSSNCRSDRRDRLRSRASLFTGSIVWLTLAGGCAPGCAAAWDGGAALSLAGGHESDLQIDPLLARDAVPGGGFFELAPSGQLHGRLGRRTWLRASGRGVWQQFVAEDRRRLIGAGVNGDLVWRGGGWRLRCSGGGSYLDDSERAALRRFDGGVEAALGRVTGRWLLELGGGRQQRRYPRLESIDDSGRTGAYTEATTSALASVWWRAGPRLSLSAAVMPAWTDARDPLYDARAWTAQATLVCQVFSGWRVVGALLSQERRFTARPPGEDSDSYLQFGGAVECDLAAGATLGARYAFARYEPPASGTQEMRRVMVALGMRFGRSAPPTSAGRMPPAIPRAASPPATRANEPHLFRLHAPRAGQVAVIGDFNGWDPRADPLAPDGGGWWSRRVTLPEGEHQFAYLIDGEVVTPPEADSTVADGFGGRNGLLRVLPAGM